MLEDYESQQADGIIQGCYLQPYKQVYRNVGVEVEFEKEGDSREFPSGAHLRRVYLPRPKWGTTW